MGQSVGSEFVVERLTSRREGLKLGWEGDRRVRSRVRAVVALGSRVRAVVIGGAIGGAGCGVGGGGGGGPGRLESG